MHVIPSAPTHTPDLQSVANELQSVLSMHCMQNCLSTVDCSCPASCEVSCPTTNDLIGPKLAMVQRKSPGCDSRVSMLWSRLLTAALLKLSCVRSVVASTLNCRSPTMSMSVWPAVPLVVSSETRHLAVPMTTPNSTGSLSCVMSCVVS